jgi:hypothetical protein
LAARQALLEEARAEAAQRSALLRQRGERLQRWRQHLRQQRQQVLELLQQTTHSETAHQTLQEQLRRRTTTLAQREAQQQAWETAQQARQSQLETQTQALSQAQREWDLAARQEREGLEARRASLDEQAIQLQRDKTLLAEQEAQLAASQRILEEKQEQADRESQRVVQEESHLAAAQKRLLDSLPGILRAAETSLERLTTARVQLRTQLEEIHAYRQRCHDEITARRQEASQALRQLDERYQVLQRLQDEQRLEAAAQRQECLSWQSQIDALELKWRTSQRELAAQTERLALHSRELERNQSRLEVQAEALEGEAKSVAYRRSEVNRHLGEMQTWYQHKLRDLAEKKLPQQMAGDFEAEDSPNILPLQTTRGNTDAHLADLLSGMGLVDAVTLQALLEEARQQRVSLRDCLLQNEFLTPYQMELIEAGRLESLVLNSLRVIDRIRIGPLETIYRVFDPRLGEEAILRHLSSSVDPAWQDEYRGLFAQAALIRHPGVAATLEVLEMNGSPAVVQEWLVGLPGNEWQGLVTEPSVALRLILQAAAGLAALHGAGLVHGQLHAGRLLLTPQGELKVCGAGEPRWLSGLSSTHQQESRDDVADLVEVVLPWCRGKARKQPAGALAELIRRLEQGEFVLAPALHEAAEAVLRSMPADEGAWHRLLQFLQDRLNLPESAAPSKKSA